IEKAPFPRYHAGESLTGMAADVLHDLGLESEMDRLGFPRKGGTKVIGNDARNEFFVPVPRSTWQVRRAEFDQALLNKALSLGAGYRRGAVKYALLSGQRVCGVTYVLENETTERTVHSRVVVDCTGSGKLFSRFGAAGPSVNNEFSQRVAVFTQFRRARRDPGETSGDTLLFYSELNHWAWFIPLSSDTVSVGAVLPSERIGELGGPEAAFRRSMESMNPELLSRVDGCEMVEPIRAISNYSYRADPIVGNGWLWVGDSHSFNDPIFS